MPDDGQDPADARGDGDPSADEDRPRIEDRPDGESGLDPEDQPDRDRRVRAELAAGGGADGDGRDAASSDSTDHELPDDVLREAERLTRLARRAVDEAEAAAYRGARADGLAAHGYAAMVREDDDGDVLVCHPAEWLADDTGAGGGAEGGDARRAIDPARIDDPDRAREVPLSGAADPEGWEAVHDRNRAVADRVRAAHGDVHGTNAGALADFASNHYAKPIAALTAEELALFREEYFPRNAWPTDDQRAVLDRSLELVYDELDVPMPGR